MINRIIILILVLNCCFFTACDADNMDENTNIIAFEKKCKAIYGNDIKLFDVRNGSVGNGDSIQKNKQHSIFLFGKIADDANNTQEVQYNVQTNRLYSNEKGRVIKDATEKMEQMGIKAIYNADIYAKPKDSNLNCYFENGNSVELEEISKIKNLENYLAGYDIAIIFFTNEYDQNITDYGSINELFENNNNYNILISIAEYNCDSDRSEKNMKLNNWLGLIQEINEAEAKNKPVNWEWYFSGDKGNVLNRLTIIDNYFEKSKNKYTVRKYDSQG